MTSYTYNLPKPDVDVIKLKKDNEVKVITTTPRTSKTNEASVFGALGASAETSQTPDELKTLDEILNSETELGDNITIRTNGKIDTSKASLSGEITKQYEDTTLYIKGKTETELKEKDNQLITDGYGSTESSIASGIRHNLSKNTAITAEIAASDSKKTATTKTGKLKEEKTSVQVNLGAKTGFKDETTDFSANLNGSFGYADSALSAGGRTSEDSGAFASITGGFDYSRKLNSDEDFKVNAIANGNFAYSKTEATESLTSNASAGLAVSGFNKKSNVAYEGKVTADVYNHKLDAGKEMSAQSVGGTASIKATWNPEGKVSFYGGAAVRSYTLSGSPDLLPAQSGFTANANVGMNYKVNDALTLKTDLSAKRAHNGCHSSEVGLTANWKHLSVSGTYNSETGPGAMVKLKFDI